MRNKLFYFVLSLVWSGTVVGADNVESSSSDLMLEVEVAKAEAQRSELWAKQAKVIAEARAAEARAMDQLSEVFAEQAEASKKKAEAWASGNGAEVEAMDKQIRARLQEAMARRRQANAFAEQPRALENNDLILVEAWAKVADVWGQRAEALGKQIEALVRGNEAEAVTRADEAEAFAKQAKEAEVLAKDMGGSRNDKLISYPTPISGTGNEAKGCPKLLDKDPT